MENHDPFTMMRDGQDGGVIASMPRGDAFAAACPARKLLDRIADKWSVLILFALSDGDMRFNAIKRKIEGISQKMLSQTLRALERDGLVTRVTAGSETAVRYHITTSGQELSAAMRTLIDWAESRTGEMGFVA